MTALASFSIRVVWPATLTVLIFTSTLQAGSVVQVGIDSNLLIHEDRIHFAQWDGSLTILDARTGIPLSRRDGSIRGQLHALPEGLLATGFRGWALHEWESGRVIRENPQSSGNRMSRGILVTGDGNGRFEARRLATGEYLWEFEHPGAVRMAVHENRVLLHCTGQFGLGEPVLVLLDIESGREIHRETPPPGTIQKAAFFHEGQVIVIAGNYDPARQPARMARATKLVRYDLEGRLVAVDREVPEELGAEGRWRTAPVRWGDLWIHRDWTEARTLDPSAPTPRSPGEYRDFPWGIGEVEATFFLGDGAQLVSWKATVFDAPGPHDPFHLLELFGTGETWTSLLAPPRLHRFPGREALVAVAEWNGNVIIGTNYGRIESLSRETGESNWTYLFPYRRFYGGLRGPIPFRSELAEEHRKRNRRPDNPGIFHPLPEGETLEDAATGSRIIRQIQDPPLPAPEHVHYDPSPADPFAGLWLRSSLAWLGAIGIIGGVVFLSRTTWQRKLALEWATSLGFLSMVGTGALLFLVGWTDRASHHAILFSLLVSAMYFTVLVILNWKNRNRVSAVTGAVVLFVVLISLFGR